MNEHKYCHLNLQQQNENEVTLFSTGFPSVVGRRWVNILNNPRTFLPFCTNLTGGSAASRRFIGIPFSWN